MRIRYKIIIGNPMGCHFAEYCELEDYAKMRARDWRDGMTPREVTLQRIEFPLGPGEVKITTLTF